MGFIKKVWEQGGKRYISIDYAEMLTGQAAIDAALAAGDIQPGEDLPNDYYIRNSNKDLREFEVSGSVAITTATWGGEPDRPVTWDEFTSFWSATPPDTEAAFLRDSPWWIERDGQTVSQDRRTVLAVGSSRQPARAGARRGGSVKGMRESRLGFWAAAGVAALLLLAVVSVAGCGTGDGGTTTTTLGSGTTTTAGVVTTGSSGTTVSTSAPTTATTGIVITLPSTTSSSGVTTTTEALSSAETLLPSGHIKAMGFIDKVYIQDGKRHISIDYAQMLTGDAATTAAIAEGFIGPGETLDTDYYISNVNPAKRVFEVSDTVAITTSTRWVAGDDMGAACTWTSFKSFWGPAGALSSSEKHLHKVPWWIERDGQIVVKIDEQYLP